MDIGCFLMQLLTQFEIGEGEIGHIGQGWSYYIFGHPNESETTWG